MSNILETYKISDTRELRIFHDEFGHNPREDDNVSHMICFHKTYRLGDRHDYDTGDFDNWDELKEQLEEDYDILVICPLYLYDHSGITISGTPFGCRWDSGQVGWAFIEKKMFDEIPELFEDKANAWLASEIKEYDQYIRGDIYFFQLIEKSTCESCKAVHEEVTDSCGGFYGSDITKNGILDHIDEDAKEAILSQV